MSKLDIILLLAEGAVVGFVLGLVAARLIPQRINVTVAIKDKRRGDDPADYWKHGGAN